MSRIKELFNRKQHNVLNVYCTAGYPQLDSTLTIMQALQHSGADIIELGMPYSDPLADGPVIQASGTVALHNGMTIAKLFEQLKNLRTNNTPLGDGRTLRSNGPPLGRLGLTIKLPVILMGYMNPILQYGFERFCADAASVGVDGLILPDLPQHEFETEYGAIIKKHGLDFIFLVTPETSDERIKELDALSTGFLYAVSSSSTTGKDKDFSAVEKYLQKLQSLQLKNPVLVGFGIKDKETFDAACRHANGAIIGTAYIKALENATDVEAATKEFLSGIKE